MIHKTSSRRGTPTQHQSVVRARASTILGVSLGTSNARFKLSAGCEQTNSTSNTRGWVKRKGVENVDNEA